MVRRVDGRTALTTLDHLSASSYGQFFKCPAQWDYVHNQGIKIPPGIAAHVGSGLHGAAEVNFRQKIVTGVDLPASDLADAAVTKYRERVEKDGVLCTREERPALGRLLSEGVDRAVKFSRVLAATVAPLYRPASVEQFVKYQGPDSPVPWVGYIDLTTADNKLVDWKTAGKRWPKGREHRESQATVYRKLFRADRGIEPASTVFEVFFDSKDGAKRDDRTTVRDDADWVALQHGAGIMLRMIDHGDFPPCVPGSWNCSPTWCGLFWVCRHVSERVRRLPNV